MPRMINCEWCGKQMLKGLAKKDPDSNSVICIECYDQFNPPLKVHGNGNFVLDLEFPCCKNRTRRYIVVTEPCSGVYTLQHHYCEYQWNVELRFIRQEDGRLRHEVTWHKRRPNDLSKPLLKARMYHTLDKDGQIVAVSNRR